MTFSNNRIFEIENGNVEYINIFTRQKNVVNQNEIAFAKIII